MSLGGKMGIDEKLRYSQATTEFATSQENKIDKLDYRKHHIERHKTGHRNNYMRDYARVLYSSSFRRLQGKMQLLGVHTSKFVRNRLTHSLEVAQIARSISADLNLKHTVVAETCALAHDLGNPPFGHHGETVLNKLSSSFGGFEGNAQTLRILRILERKHHSYHGLNLTLRTLMGVTKYFNPRKIRDEEILAKKYIYDEDYAFLCDEIKQHGIPENKSIDAQIMDLADEIAYAAHDLEDSLSMKIITLDELAHEFKISKEYSPAYDALSCIIENAKREARDAIL